MNEYRLKRLLAQHYKNQFDETIIYNAKKEKHTQKKAWLLYSCNIYLLIMTWHLQVTYNY